MTNEKRQMTTDKYSDLLRQDRRLAPADHLLRRKTILMNDPEVMFGLADYFPRWMTLEAEQDLKENTGDSRMYRQVE